MSCDICYGFTATSYLPESIALYATVHGLLVALTMRQTHILWQDITDCFSYAGYPRIAVLLRRLIHDWNGAGTFTIGGPDSERQDVFNLLSRDFSQRRKPGKPHTVSIEFFQSQDPPHLTVHAHYGLLYSWRIDPIKPSPVFQFRAKDSVAC